MHVTAIQANPEVAFRKLSSIEFFYVLSNQEQTRLKGIINCTYISWLNKEYYFCTLDWKIEIVYQNMIFIHLKFSHFFTTIFRSELQIHFKKIIIILSWRSNFIMFSKRSKGLLAYMFFSRCVNRDILGIETFMTPCHYRYIKKCIKLTFGTSRRRNTWALQVLSRGMRTPP